MDKDTVKVAEVKLITPSMCPCGTKYLYVWLVSVCPHCEMPHYHICGDDPLKVSDSLGIVRGYCGGLYLLKWEWRLAPAKPERTWGQ